MLMVLCTLQSKFDQAFDLRQWASELEPDLHDAVEWVKKWFVNFNAGRTQLVSFDESKTRGLTFSSKLDQGSFIVTFAKNGEKWSHDSLD